MRRLLILLAGAVLAVCCTCSTADQALKRYRVKVVAEYPHDPSSYTQGLFFHDGALYESVGQYGESAMRRVKLETGKGERTVSLGAEIFAEGAVILDSTLYILTWQNGQVFRCDPATFAVREKVSYPREGWGLTTDGVQLIASDGSDCLYFLNDKLETVKTVHVSQNGRHRRYLNELEYIDGRVWANVYTSDEIVIINPESGKVEGLIDCTGLLPARDRDVRTDVLNGIAHDPITGKIYLTGKYWKKLFEVELVEK